MANQRINPETGELEESNGFWWTTAKNEDGHAERINPDTGVREESNGYGTWSPAKNENDHAERINPDTGVREESNGYGTWSPSESENGHAERINPETGGREESNGLGSWSPAKNDAGHAERINPKTGEREESNGFGSWSPTKSSSRHSACETGPSYESDSSSQTSSTSSYSSEGNSSNSSSGSSGIGVGTVIILGIVALVAFKSINSQPARNYQPVAVANPTPAPMPQRNYPAARSEGGPTMSLQGSWPDGYTATRTIVIPDSGLFTFNERILVGDDLEVVLKPLWVMDFETIGDTLEIAVDEGEGFKSLNELTIGHSLIPRENGKPWLLTRRIMRFHRTDMNSVLYSPLQFRVHQMTMAEITQMRKPD
jgi:hypothetical protein